MTSFKYAGDIEATGGQLRSTTAVISGAVTLGLVEGDAVTMKAGIQTIQANQTITRAVGAAPASGPTVIENHVTTFTSDPSTPSYVDPYYFNAQSSGSSAFDTIIVARFVADHSGSAPVTGTLRCISNGMNHGGSGLVARMVGFYNRSGVTAAGSATNVDGFVAGTPTYTSTGTTATARGYVVENQGNVRTTQVIGFHLEDQTTSTTIYGLKSDITVGAGKWGLYIGGGAQSFIGGKVGIGGNFPNGTDALLVTGSFQVTGTSKFGDLLVFAGTVAAPASSGSAANGMARFNNSSTSTLALDMGLDGGAALAWIQARDTSSYASNYKLALNPNGGAIAHGPGNLGFFGTAPAAKPTVTGSRGANAALASLLTALAGLGLLTDSSS